MRRTNLVWNRRPLGLIGAFSIVLKSTFNRLLDSITTLVVKSNLGKVGENVHIHKGITYRYPKNIRLGNNITVARNVTLFSENENGYLNVDDNVIITFDVRLDFSGGLKIGKNSLISKNTIIETHDHGLDPHAQPIYRSLDIGENVWVGMNVTILSEVRKIGSNSIIAAGSIVTKEVSENCIVGGIPAKLIKRLDN